MFLPGVSQVSLSDMLDNISHNFEHTRTFEESNTVFELTHRDAVYLDVRRNHEEHRPVFRVVMWEYTVVS